MSPSWRDLKAQFAREREAMSRWEESLADTLVHALPATPHFDPATHPVTRSAPRDPASPAVNFNPVFGSTPRDKKVGGAKSTTPLSRKSPNCGEFRTPKTPKTPKTPNLVSRRLGSKFDNFDEDSMTNSATPVGEEDMEQPQQETLLTSRIQSYKPRAKEYQDRKHSV